MIRRNVVHGAEYSENSSEEVVGEGEGYGLVLSGEVLEMSTTGVEPGSVGF